MKRMVALSIIVVVAAGCVAFGALGPKVWPCGSEPYLSPNRAAELFALPNGVNEFDLWYVGGRYHMWHQDRRVDPEHRRWAQYRTATSIAGLKNATAIDIEGSYPSALHYRGTWHLWLWDHLDLVTRHHTSANPQGPWAEQGHTPENWADWHVRRSPYDGRFYGVYKHLISRFAGAAVADSPNGPWTDLGPIVPDEMRQPWHELEEADPAIYFDEGRAYVFFAGWDGAWQRVGVVEVDPVTIRAVEPAHVLVEPTLGWQQRHDVCKVFNPVPLNGHLYFAHNPSDDGLAAGWGRLSLDLP